jgi:hypothetical protein
MIARATALALEDASSNRTVKVDGFAASFGGAIRSESKHSCKNNAMHGAIRLVRRLQQRVLEGQSFVTLDTERMNAIADT